MSATASYARAKGREVAAPAPVRAVAELRPLSERERELVAENYALVKTHLPEIVPLVKELHDAGMVDGLRCIVRAELIEKES